jgi:hypothetical protein
MTFLRARTFIACLPLRSGIVVSAFDSLARLGSWIGTGIWILGLVGLVVAGFGAAGSAMLLMLLGMYCSAKGFNSILISLKQTIRLP